MVRKHIAKNGACSLTLAHHKTLSEAHKIVIQQIFWFISFSRSRIKKKNWKKIWDLSGSGSTSSSSLIRRKKGEKKIWIYRNVKAVTNFALQPFSLVWVRHLAGRKHKHTLILVGEKKSLRNRQNRNSTLSPPIILTTWLCSEHISAVRRVVCSSGTALKNNLKRFYMICLCSLCRKAPKLS